MKHFSISIHSLEQVQSFVDLATAQPFAVLVGSDTCQVSGKNFMGMFSLDLHRPLDVTVDCDEDSFTRFRQKAVELFAS